MTPCMNYLVQIKLKKNKTGEIEIAPLAFMRGRTLKNCFAILDEAQNATETQIKNVFNKDRRKFKISCEW